MTDVVHESIEISEYDGVRVGYLSNCNHNFASKLVKVNQNVALELCGFPSDAMRQVFGNSWLVAKDNEVHLELARQHIARLAAADSRRFSAEIKGMKVALRAPVVFRSLTSRKYEAFVDLPCLEKPKLEPPKRLPNSFVEDQLCGVLGTVNAGPGVGLVNITVQDAMRYMMFDDESEDAIRSEITSRCPDVRFFGSPSAVFEHAVDWIDRERKFEVVFDLSDDRVRIGEVWTIVEGYFRHAKKQDPRLRRSLEIQWLHGS